MHFKKLLTINVFLKFSITHIQTLVKKKDETYLKGNKKKFIKMNIFNIKML